MPARMIEHAMSSACCLAGLERVLLQAGSPTHRLSLVVESSTQVEVLALVQAGNPTPLLPAIVEASKPAQLLQEASASGNATTICTAQLYVRMQPGMAML